MIFGLKYLLSPPIREMKLLSEMNTIDPFQYMVSPIKSTGKFELDSVLMILKMYLSTGSVVNIN